MNVVFLHVNTFTYSYNVFCWSCECRSNQHHSMQGRPKTVLRSMQASILTSPLHVTFRPWKPIN